METKQDFWFWLSVSIAVVAIFIWALLTTLNFGGVWVTLVAGTVVMVACGSQGVRAWYKAKGVVLVEESREARRLRAWQQIRGIVPLFLFASGQLILVSVDKMLPLWVGDGLWLILLAGCYWLWRLIRRKEESSKHD